MHAIEWSRCGARPFPKLRALRFCVGLATAALMLAAHPSVAQTAAPATPEAGSEFASENAILDTSILFAIGAREARQELRGAFGWPTFQEGLVMGVYFRFDPDGYARFSPTPRLDADVFEVICRPRTLSCMGRKGGLSMFLDSRGALQLKMDNAAEGDRFFISDGIDQLELPTRIVMPLDQQLELLLSSTDGELAIRRGDNDVERISLKGFGPVAAYLRWLLANQDYTVLPRGWPVPNGGASPSGVTQATNWQSPMPQPQNLPIQGAEAAAAAAAGTEVAEVRGELRVLRELLLNRPTETTQTAAPQAASPQYPTAAPNQFANPALMQVPGQIPGQFPAQVPGAFTNQTPWPGQAQMPQFPTAPAAPAHMTGPGDRISALEQAAGDILSQIDQLRGIKPPEPAMQKPQTMAAEAPAPATPPLTNSTAERLDYLMREIGLDAKTALMLVELGDRQKQGEAPQAPQAGIADSILAQLEKDLTTAAAPAMAPEPAPTPAPAPASQDSVVMVTPQEYQLLSSYFRSVLTPSQ